MQGARINFIASKWWVPAGAIKERGVISNVYTDVYIFFAHTYMNMMRHIKFLITYPSKGGIHSSTLFGHYQVKALVKSFHMTLCEK